MSDKTAISCFYCNSVMNTDLNAIMVTSIGGKSGTDVKNMEDVNEKFIESVKAKLCSCPVCKRKERVLSEDIEWISMKDVMDAIKEGRIVSNNPEIELIFKILEFTLKSK